MVKVSYKELTKDLEDLSQAQTKDPLEKYSLDIDGDMKEPNALTAINAIDGASPSFTARAQFVKSILMGTKVTVYKNGEKKFSISVTPGTEWWAEEELNKDPMALRFIVIAVYTRFLKKLVA